MTAEQKPNSPRPAIAGVLREIAVRGLLADVVLLVVAMALGGVEGNSGLAAGALVTLVILGNGLDGLRTLRHSIPLYILKHDLFRKPASTFRDHACNRTRVNDRRGGIVPHVRR